MGIKGLSSACRCAAEPVLPARAFARVIALARATRMVASFTNGHNSPLGRHGCRAQGDGEKVVSGARDGTVRVWEAEGGKTRFVLQGFTAYLGSLQISPTWLLADGTNNAVMARRTEPIPWNWLAPHIYICPLHREMPK